MDDTALAVILAGISIVPLFLIFRVLDRKMPVWAGVLAGLGCVVPAVGFFWAWQWAQHPVLAYIDATVYGLLALLVPLFAVNRRLIPGNEQRVPDGAGEQDGP